MTLENAVVVEESSEMTRENTGNVLEKAAVVVKWRLMMRLWRMMGMWRG